jgi:hypothetical protein
METLEEKIKTVKEKIETLLPITREEVKRKCEMFREEQVKILQEINRLILTEYMIEINEGLCLYPIEVEAYYYEEFIFQDSSVHRNELQKGRFGQLYFHRAGRKKEHAFLFDGGGVDICLSSGDYYFGILIRSAWINDDKEPVCGPGLLTRRIVQHITGETAIANVEDYRFKIEEVENKTTLIKPRKRDISKEYQPADEYPIMNGKRIRIKEETHGAYSNYKLRALIGLKKNTHTFEDKIKMVISYFEEAGGEVTCERIKKILGANDKEIFDHFNNKKAENKDI